MDDSFAEFLARVWLEQQKRCDEHERTRSHKAPRAESLLVSRKIRPESMSEGFMLKPILCGVDSLDIRTQVSDHKP